MSLKRAARFVGSRISEFWVEFWEGSMQNLVLVDTIQFCCKFWINYQLPRCVQYPTNAPDTSLILGVGGLDLQTLFMMV